ncbi:hypothetical protein GCM10027341_42840 [Spirosoma knui]
MKAFRYSNQDEAMQLVSIPVYIGILNSILLGRTYWSNWRVFLFATALTLVVAYVNWLINNSVGLFISRQYPLVRQTGIRLLYLFIWCLFMGGVACTSIYLAYTQVSSPTLPLNPGRLPWAWLFNGLTVVSIISLYEGILAFERWERTLRETEQLKKANLQNQFESLKSQINPHFLFNSLNTLSSLIEEDSQQAEQFVEEMASVYRYLLRSNETQLATLADELAFAHSYFHLLRTRYGEHIQLEQTVDPHYQHYLLPPLTLQLLLENTVKHNVILPEQPLHIAIATQPDGRLMVRNNLQRKNSRVLSNQVGLANIATQYELLGGGQLNVEDDAQYFTVTLPLLRQP